MEMPWKGVGKMEKRHEQGAGPVLASTHENSGEAAGSGSPEKSGRKSSGDGRDSLESLKGTVDVIKKEVDALQIASAREHKPFYMNVPVVVSILALLFSFGTTLVSYRKANLEDIHNSRKELRDILQRLAELPRENFLAQQQFSDVRKAAFVSGVINQENSLLAKQAAEVAARIPAHISSPEYMAIAVALENSLEREGMLKHLRRAIDTADNANDETTALRMHGAFYFKNGDAERGRAILQQALDIFEKYPENDEITRKATRLQTHLFWASLAFGHGFNTESTEHLKFAEQILKELPPGPGKEQFSTQIREATLQFQGPADHKASLLSASPPVRRPRSVAPAAFMTNETMF